MTGFLEYLLHADFCLYHYDSILTASRKHEDVRLKLIRLSDADLMDLGPVLATSLEEAQEADRQVSAQNGDDWGIQELESAKNENSGISWTPMPYIPVRDIQWPFRVLVQGVQDCPDQMPGSHLHVEVCLYHNGRALRHSSQPEVLSTVTVPFSKEPRWPAQWISFPYEVANLPLSTRIGKCLLDLHICAHSRRNFDNMP